MPPRTRQKSTAPEHDEEVTDATVADLSAARVDLDLDAEAARIEDLEPFTFRLGGRDWTVEPPGVDESLDAEQAPFVQDVFEILMGDELWAEFEPVFREQTKPALAWKLGTAMTRAFKLDARSVQEDVERDDARRGNREDRRRARRQQPRRR